MTKIVNFIDKLSEFTGKLFGWLILPLVLALSYEVFARYLFRRPTIWAFDITYMLMSAIFLAGAAYTLSEHRHIRIDFLYAKFSNHRKAVIDLIGFLILFIPIIYYTAFFALKKFFWAIEIHEKSDISPWHPVMWPFRGFIALGFVLLAIQCFAEVLKSIATVFNRGKNNG